MSDKFAITPQLSELIRGVAKLKGVAPRLVAHELFLTIEALLSDQKLSLGVLFDKVFRGLQESKAPSRTFDVPLEELETSKNRSGFTGVYWHADKWRARVPDPSRGGAARTLDGHDEALDAAIDRYRWFEDHGLPYGNLAFHVEHWRKMRPSWSLQDTLEFLVVQARTLNMTDIKNPFTYEHALRTYTRWREKNGLAPVEPGQIAGPDASYAIAREVSAKVDVVSPKDDGVSAEAVRDAAGEFVILCTTCKKPIEDAHDARFWGTDDFLHKSCPDPTASQLKS